MPIDRACAHTIEESGPSVDSLNTAVLVIDDGYRLCFLNSAAETLLALSRSRAVGRNLTDLIDDGGILVQAADRVRHDPRTLTVRELPVNPGSPPSEAVQVDCTVSPLEPYAPGAVLIELNRVDRLSRIAREQLTRTRQEANRAVMQGLAHEIKNPLGGLRGAAQLLDRELTDRELREYTRIIIHEADRLTHLVDRMTGGCRSVDPQPLNIHEVVEHVRKLLVVEAPEGIELKCDYDPSLPLVHGDRAGLIQAVLNIARNALDAVGSRGRIVLRTRIARRRTVDTMPYRQLLQLDVIDDGPGVPRSLGAQVFEPMVTGRPEGTGLGLTIAQEIAAQHGSLIEFQSRPGRTCFSLYIPIDDARH